MKLFKRFVKIFGMTEAEPESFTFLYRTIEGITLRCRDEGCEWSATDKIIIETSTGAVAESPLVNAGRQHHIENRGSEHNQFCLLMNEREVGFVSISSGSHSGIVNDL